MRCPLRREWLSVREDERAALRTAYQAAAHVVLSGATGTDRRAVAEAAATVLTADDAVVLRIDGSRIFSLEQFTEHVLALLREVAEQEHPVTEQPYRWWSSRGGEAARSSIPQSGVLPWPTSSADEWAIVVSWFADKDGLEAIEIDRALDDAPVEVLNFSDWLRDADVPSVRHLTQVLGDIKGLVDLMRGLGWYEENLTAAPPEPCRLPRDHMMRWLDEGPEQLWLPMVGMWRPLPDNLPCIRDLQGARSEAEQLEPEHACTAGDHSLGAALAGVLRAAAERARPACLLIEAADVLIAALSEAELNALAELLHAEPKLGLVLSTSNVGALQPVLVSTDIRCDLDAPVRPAAIRRFLDVSFASGGIACSEEAVDALLDAAGGSLLAVQRLAHVCWEFYRPGRDAPPVDLTPRHVHNAAVEVAMRLDPLHEQQWRGLAAGQRAALLAVLANDGQGLSREAAFTAVGMANATSMQRAIEALMERGMIWREPARGPKSPGRVRFADTSFALWLRLVPPEVATTLLVRCA